MSPTHGKDGWDLTAYSWDPETGLARAHYARGEEMVEVELEQLRYHTKPAGNPPSV